MRADELCDTISRVRARPVEPDHLRLLRRYSDAIQQLTLATRKVILEEAPQANEFIYEVYTIADHFTFTERPGDAFVFTTSHSNWVNLGFNFGAFLPDPDAMLRGEGKLIRHVRIAQTEDLKVSGVRDLIRAAIARADRPPGKPEKGRTVVHTKQSAGAPRRSRRSKP